MNLIRSIYSDSSLAHAYWYDSNVADHHSENDNDFQWMSASTAYDGSNTTALGTVGI